MNALPPACWDRERYVHDGYRAAKRCGGIKIMKGQLTVVIFSKTFGIDFSFNYRAKSTAVICRHTSGSPLSSKLRTHTILALDKKVLSFFKTSASRLFLIEWLHAFVKFLVKFDVMHEILNSCY